jgi:hypothetical protein
MFLRIIFLFVIVSNFQILVFEQKSYSSDDESCHCKSDLDHSSSTVSVSERPPFVLGRVESLLALHPQISPFPYFEQLMRALRKQTTPTSKRQCTEEAEKELLQFIMQNRHLNWSEQLREDDYVILKVKALVKGLQRFLGEWHPMTSNLPLSLFVPGAITYWDRSGEERIARRGQKEPGYDDWLDAVEISMTEGILSHKGYGDPRVVEHRTIGSAMRPGYAAVDYHETGRGAAPAYGSVFYELSRVYDQFATQTAEASMGGGDTSLYSLDDPECLLLAKMRGPRIGNTFVETMARYTEAYYEQEYFPVYNKPILLHILDEGTVISHKSGRSLATPEVRFTERQIWAPVLFSKGLGTLHFGPPEEEMKTWAGTPSDKLRRARNIFHNAEKFAKAHEIPFVYDDSWDDIIE